MKFMLPISAILLAVLAVPAEAQTDVSFKKGIQPILDDYCVSCHKPEGKGFEKSGLDLRSYQGVLKGTRFGSVVKPGDSFTSILIQVVEGRVHAAIRMPYGMSGGLSRENIGLLKRWVDQGAKDN